MGYLQVRDFPEELHQELRVLARKEHRSVSQQTIIAIEEYLEKRSAAQHDTPENDVSEAKVSKQNQRYLERRRQVFKKIREASVPELNLTPEEIVKTIHEGREECDARFRL